MKKLLFVALAALLPAVALAAAVDEPLTPRDFIQPRPSVQLSPAGVPDSPPKDGKWIKVRGIKDPIFQQHGFPLPYPPCWLARHPTQTCIEDENSAHPPRP